MGARAPPEVTGFAPRAVRCLPARHHLVDNSPAQPLLERAFAALDHAAVRWCLLRGASEAGSDVDLLVERDAGPVIDAALSSSGMLLLRAWGGQRFYLGLDALAGDWVVFHLTERLTFGSRYELVLGGERGCLERARRDERNHPVAAPADEVWVLVAHALLDKRRVDDKHRRRIGEIAVAAAPDLGLGRALGEIVGGDWPSRLLDLAQAERWDDLQAMGPDLEAAWRARRRGQVLVAGLRNALALLTRKTIEPWRSPGMRVALMAPDGAGKSTVATRLAEAYFFGGRVIYLGLYGAQDRVINSPIPGLGLVQRLVRMRWRASVARYHASRRRLVVFDRHPLDAAVAPGRSGVRRRLLASSVPAPDLIVVLDAPADVLHARKPDHSVVMLATMRQAYLDLAARRPDAVVVDASRSLDHVVADVLAEVWEWYLTRARVRASAAPT